VFSDFHEFVNIKQLPNKSCENLSEADKKHKKSFPLFFFASFVYPVAPGDGTGAALREIFMVPRFWFHKCGITVSLRPACPG